MLSNSKVDFKNLIRMTSTGLVAADYAQLRTAIATRFKEIYGDDIDISSLTADGVYIETLSFMMNNMLQSIVDFINNFDVRKAYGDSLTKLCLLSNVQRGSGSFSKATLKMYVQSYQKKFTVGIGQTYESLTFLDQAGKTWKYTPEQPTTFSPDTTYEIEVVCTELGQIYANAGWITIPVDSSLFIDITQSYDAIPGEQIESDTSLRARQSQVLGTYGKSILQTLVGSLYTLSTVRDIKIYNNNTLTEITAKDGTVIPKANIYVILRIETTNLNTQDSSIANILYKKMTPGIHTTQTTDTTTGINKVFDYQNVASDEELISDSPVEQYVYWKQAKPKTTNITVTIQTEDSYVDTTDDLIKQRIVNYVNSLPLSTDLTNLNIQKEVSYADPLYNGRYTFIVTNSSISSPSNPDTYFNISTSNITITKV